MSIEAEIQTIGAHAKRAAGELNLIGSRKKNLILQSMADALEEQRHAIAIANEKDLAAGRENGLSSALLDRLRLDDQRMDSMIKGIRDVADLKDPIGTRISRWIRPNGLQIIKQRVPIGVIGIIYESRPNVTADTAALCIKTSNAVILRGGKEAMHSNAAIADALAEGGQRKGLPDHAIQLVRTTDRAAVSALLKMDDKLDLIIPRGGEALIRTVTEQARMPVIKHYKGVCHTYVDAQADLEMATEIAVNAKCHRPGVCNAMETLLVHEEVAAAFLPRVGKRLEAAGVELRGDARTCELVPTAMPATEEDWFEEYLDLILAIRVVPSLDEAVEHINTYGSRHSDAIVSSDEVAQNAFLKRVDSSTVYVNASTRFTDGAEFGMGAEIGISTDKLHARGPMGLEELTTYKYLIMGKGQIRD
jgi:glutamate-5-semialdehyde dehydrogenase